ncbi:hypothetical protein CDAR_318251 [Caerostris darwini]|uniref:Uncharacterized protein n=1 Tax=Caerostris darwini TaxID=1538125 RepID=A0AAV4T5F7_9ARAC|nr:hypothetical protein CDAR_318251 [Caerostris darwini]
MDTIGHPPQRRRRQIRSTRTRSNRRNQNLSRPNTAIILPAEYGTITLDISGIANPCYNPTVHIINSTIELPPVSDPSWNQPKNENPVPLADEPPTYDAVVKDQYPSIPSNTTS